MWRPVALITPMFIGFFLAACATMSLDSAPERPDAPWTPVVTSQGEVVAGSAPVAGQPKAGNYILPSNRDLAEAPPAASDLERRNPYTLPELINIAQTSKQAIGRMPMMRK